jgi:hypothetical protein
MNFIMQNILITGSKGQLGTDGLDVFKEVPGLSGIDLPEVMVNCSAYIETIKAI